MLNVRGVRLRNQEHGLPTLFFSQWTTFRGLLKHDDVVEDCIALAGLLACILDLIMNVIAT